MDLRRRTRLALASLLAIMMAAAAPTIGAVAEAHPQHGRGGRPLTVMTQNLYLGAGLEGAIAASSPGEFVVAAAQIYGTAVATNFPRRAESIADTIADEQPDLIGLQEVSRLTAERTAAGPALPSYDFLAVLQAELVERGLAYRVAAVSENADIGPVPLLAPASGCTIVGPTPDCVVRLQDRDVVLVDDDTPRLRVQTARTGRYTAQQVLRLPDGTTASFARGWAFVDGRFKGRKFRFVNTHLEVASSAAVQEAQAREFLAGPARTRRTVVAVGDFNSAADPAVASTTTYEELTAARFRDAWLRARPDDPGLTCCQSPTLAGTSSRLRTRIDLVLTRGRVRVDDAVVVGATPIAATTPPFWASDHAGVVATLRLR